MDIIVYGATGFTGQLVSAYLSKVPTVRWGVAGRDSNKLTQLNEAMMDKLNPPQETVRVSAADSDEAADMLASTARVVLSTAGPFSLYSDRVVKACARRGTAYVDINGEIPWVKRVIERDAAEAERSGAIIVPNCGFDSIPSDLGALIASKRADRLEGHVKFAGTMSGGTIATGILMNSEFPQEMRDPALIGGVGEADSFEVRPPTDSRPYWLAPFGMAPINTRVVRRSAVLNGYGDGFRYNEFAVAPSEAVAIKMAKNAQVPPEKLRALVDAGKLPKPSTGPDEDTRAQSWFELTVFSADDPGTPLASVSGGDPGYDETAKMVAEAALTLAMSRHDQLPCAGSGGVWTPASGLGMALVDRLKQAGLKITDHISEP